MKEWVMMPPYMSVKVRKTTCTTKGTTCPALYEECMGSLTSHRLFYYMCKGLWDEVYGLSSLSERTRKSNRLQMLLQRQHLFLSYLKTLSVGPAGFEQTASHSVDRRLSHWANRANIRGCPDLIPGNHSLGTDSKWCSVDTESHTDRFNSCRGLRFFLCPVLVTCWLHRFA